MNIPSSSFSYLSIPWTSRMTGLLIVFFILCIIPLSRSDPRATEAGLFCDQSGQPVDPDISFPLFTREMEVLSQRVADNGWAQSGGNSGNISIYALFQCYGDLSGNDCLQCYAAGRTRLPRCLPYLSGRLFLDGCFLRYDRYDFFNESVDPTWDTANCNETVGVSGRVEPEFGRDVGELIDSVTADAVDSGGYAVGEVKGVFGLAECWKTVSLEGCRACLEKAKTEVRGCLPSREGRALNAGCYLRYSTEKFYSNQSQPNSSNSGISRKGKAVAISLSVVAFFLFSLFAVYSIYVRWRKREQERINLGRISNSYNKSKLNFKYETLEKATNYFDDERKLGQGGAGSVYKGILPDGRTVAVKRLFFSSRQWVDEFFNEVNLISGIDHKNLVKLLGCSIEGPESLLVFEFVPNKSLEHHLFVSGADKNKVNILTWKERYNIVLGTAEGLAFLHGSLDFRIIHRDIKSSNVLVDENFNPKIADFGLARLFASDKSHLSTGIAGTLGYMAPEYLVKGQLTEKADIYSFGVVVLEIVCGRRSNAFEDSDSLLQTVWNMYKMDRLTESVDPSLENDFPVNEASKVLRIGLLCAQAYASQRPSMMEVIKMLRDQNYEIPDPNQPPFLTAGSFSAGSTRSSFTTNSSIPNAVTRHGVSSSFTGSSGFESSQVQSKIEEHRLL